MLKRESVCVCVNSRRRRGDGGQLEAGAVGLAGLDGRQAGAGTGDLASAVVGSASTLVEGAGHDGGSEGEDDGDLHLDG